MIHVAPLSISAWDTVFTVCYEIFVVWSEKKKKEKRAALLKAVFDAIVSMVSIRLKLDNEYSQTVYMY